MKFDDRLESSEQHSSVLRNAGRESAPARRLWLAIALAMFVSGCPPLAETPDGGSFDGGVTLDDGGMLEDEDGGAVEDAGTTDGGSQDGGPLDGGRVDGGLPDGGRPDGGPLDGGRLDGGPPDAGTVVQASGPSGSGAEIPPGATADPSAIRVELASSGFTAVPAAIQSPGSVFAFTPHGLQFSRPVKVRVPFAGGASGKLYTSDPGGVWSEVVGATRVGNVFEASVNHFSFFAGGTPAPTWVSITDNLPTTSSSSVLFHCGGGVFAGNERGVYIRGSSATWIAGSTGLPAATSVLQLAGRPNGNSFLAATDKGPYKTACGILSWSSLASTNSGWPQYATFNVPLTARSVAYNGSVIYAGATGSSANGGLYRSGDEGQTWTKLSAYEHFLAGDADILSIAFAPGKIVIGSLNRGVSVSTDQGASWARSEVGETSGSRVFQVLALNGFVFAATQTGLFRSASGGAPWTKIATAQVPSNYPIYGLTQIGARLVADLGYAGIHYSDDNGTTFTPYFEGLPMGGGGAYPERWSIATDGAELIGSAYLGSTGRFDIYRAAAPPQ